MHSPHCPPEGTRPPTSRSSGASRELFTHPAVLCWESPRQRGRVRLLASVEGGGPCSWCREKLLPFTGGTQIFSRGLCGRAVQSRPQSNRAPPFGAPPSSRRLYFPFSTKGMFGTLSQQREKRACSQLTVPASGPRPGQAQVGCGGGWGTRARPAFRSTCCLGTTVLAAAVH